MKKKNAKIALLMAMLMVCSMVLVMVPANIQTASADAPPSTTLDGGTNSTPVDGSIVAVAQLNMSSYFLTANGTVLAYGTGTSGELGNGVTANSAVATPVIKAVDDSVLTGIDRIWSNHNYAMYAYDYDTNKLYAWGLNGNFRVDPTQAATAKINKAVEVALPAGVEVADAENAIAVGAQSVALLDQNGNVWTWGNMADTTAGKTDMNFLGYNFVADGTLGDHAGETIVLTTVTNMVVPHQAPLPLNAGEKVVNVQMGWVGVFYALTSAGRIIAWGGNNAAGLSINTLYGAPFVTLDNPAGVTMTSMAIGKSSNVSAIGSDGHVYVLNGYQFVGDLVLTANQRPVVPMTRSKQLVEPTYLRPTPAPTPTPGPTPEPTPEPTPTPVPTPTPAGYFATINLSKNVEHAVVGNQLVVTMNIDSNVRLGVFMANVSFDAAKLGFVSAAYTGPVAAGEMDITPGAGTVGLLWLDDQGGLTGIPTGGADVLTMTFNVLTAGATSVSAVFDVMGAEDMGAVTTWVNPLNFEAYTVAPTPTPEPAATPAPGTPTPDPGPQYDPALDYDLNNDGIEDVTFTDVASAADNSSKWFTQSYMALRSDGEVLVWGNESVARLGDGVSTQDAVRTAAVSIDTLPNFPVAATDFAGGAISWQFNAGLMIKGGVIYGWGQNNYDAGLDMGKLYPMQTDLAGTEGLQAQSWWPRPIKTAALPALTAVADVGYELSVSVPTLATEANLTISGLNANLEGKTIDFMLNGEVKASGVVAGGVATAVATGVYNGTYEVTAQSQDADNLLWAPALNSITFEVDSPIKVPPVPGVADFSPVNYELDPVEVGETVVITGKLVSDLHDIAVFQVDVEYDITKLTLVSVQGIGDIVAGELEVVELQPGVLTVLYLDMDGGDTPILSSLNSSIFEITFTAIAQGDATVSIDPVTVGNPLLQEVTATGNSTTFAIYPVDVNAPVVSGVVEGGMYMNNRVVTWTDINPTTATLNGAPIASGDTVNADGVYQLVVTDAVGNVTTVNFTVDKTAPVISGFNNGAYYRVPVTVTYTDLNAVTATLFGAPIASGSVVTAEGFYTIIAKDAAGNITTKSFFIDATAPVVTGVEQGGVYNVSKTISFNEGSATLNGAEFLNGRTVVAEGNYTLVVTDLAGNATTVSFKVDKTAPVVMGAVSGAYYNTSRIIIFNEGAATLNGVPLKNGTVLNQEGHYTVVVTDAAGNSTTITDFVIDKTAPVITGALDALTYNTDRVMVYNDLNGASATLNGDAIANGATVGNVGYYTYTVTDPAGNSTTVDFILEDVTMVWAKHVDNSITGFNAAGTSVAEVKAGIQVAGTTTMIVTNLGATLDDATSIKTGMQVELRDDNDVLFAVHQIAIIGDVTGDGKITAIDLLKVKKVILGTVTVEGAYATAADINKDDVVNAMDLLALKKHVLGQIIIAQ